ncbi:small multidrug resistance pump [Streptoalloteichus tenebrarius]|uniref:Small multidrug resistance pump n=1 Tax=Streptoalloteichus tenebrarius (strain ATCC 17920 / DSM 40477 / JCM 4838 / CBS 697.72 / NBRC 16177 / NCIMB 11028 / NRRL B-12390 / A12253. 1 / ISP 5477) TaxID=1933 RepID=A0ABT1I3Y3_STRSD|nr:multidrug efflux SMR transporter [Streptoalloteichus tenebrarius]MCP2262497.1 small multidrug resistance pump [Streptoalloteichus tenebrarius]BFE99667.1 multidrug efflux SMR transporter [Streptoalloteichus tenebrarius]
MGYLLLAVAILVEIVATTLLKLSDGFTKLWPSVGAVAGYLVTFALLAQVMRTVPMSVAYAIWAGAGVALIATIGVLAMGEPMTLLKAGGLVLVVAGVVALNLSGAH